MKRSTHHILSVEIPPTLLDPTKYNSYWKLLRVTASIFHIRQIALRRERPYGELVASELQAAQSYWIQAVPREYFPVEIKALNENLPLPDGSKIARFNPFLDEGLIHLGGRLQFADLSGQQRHPLLLDGQHHFTKLLVMQTHIRLHRLGVCIVPVELRHEFWILCARQTIKKVLNTCPPCKIAKNPFGREIEAPLQAERVTPLRPFAVTGIDFAGPLYIKVGNDTWKCYITLSTCAITRAIHLELCMAMMTDKFLLTLQRFISRRGLQHTIYMDNTQTFHASNGELT
jgi:hypothetical protein